MRAPLVDGSSAGENGNGSVISPRSFRRSSPGGVASPAIVSFGFAIAPPTLASVSVVIGGWSRRPRVVDGDRQQGLPLGLDEVCARSDRRPCLLFAGDVARSPDETAALTAVPAHAVRLDVELARPGRDVQRHLVSVLRTHHVRIALDRARLAGVGDLPVGGPRLGVLGDDPLGVERVVGRAFRGRGW